MIAFGLSPWIAISVLFRSDLNPSTAIALIPGVVWEAFAPLDAFFVTFALTRPALFHRTSTTSRTPHTRFPTCDTTRPSPCAAPPVLARDGTSTSSSAMTCC